MLTPLSTFSAPRRFPRLPTASMCCRITKKVISGVYQGVTTVELDNLASETAAYLTTKHPDYAILAARIAISNLHKETKKSFSQVIQDLYNYVNPKNGKPAGMISKETYECVMDNAELLDSSIIYERDFHYNLWVVFFHDDFWVLISRHG